MAASDFDWIAKHAAASPDRVALTDAATGEATSYAQWDRRVTQTAAWLRQRGVAKGERVGILVQRRIDALDLFFACTKLGAVAQMLSVRLAAPELDGLLAKAPPRVLVHDRAGIDVRCPTATIGERAEACAEGFTPAAVDASDPSTIIYTGGSTGVPKAAVLTFGNVAANAAITVAGWGLVPDDVTILNAPLFHVGGLFVLTTPLVLVGGHSIVCDRFEAGQVLSLVETAGVTLLFGVPTMHLALCRHSRFATTDVSRVRLVMSGGAPCPAGVIDAMFERGLPFRQGYGLTEAGPNNFVMAPEVARRKPTSVGVPLDGISAKVLGEGGAEAPRGTPGELVLRGPHVFAGYLDEPAETARALRDGWLHTGDLAVVDDEGIFSIVGRLKDVIICGGEKIYPAEIESVLSQHPAVAEVCVIGVEDGRLGEVGRAVVVASGERDDLLSYARARLARFKVPRDVVYADALPRTMTGKLDRRAVVETFGARKR